MPAVRKGQKKALLPPLSGVMGRKHEAKHAGHGLNLHEQVSP